MSRGDVVLSPSGEEVVLADIGHTVLVETPEVRIWDVSLAPGEVHPWHRHANPYVVVNLAASPGRMDWLDGSPPRHLQEYVGGAVYRPVSPVHRLTNVGETAYQNRLIELLALGENLLAPLDVGAGGRSIDGERPGEELADGRRPVLLHRHVSIWDVDIPARGAITLELAALPHVVVTIPPPGAADDPQGGARLTGGATTTLTNPSEGPVTHVVVELTYLQDLAAVLEGEDHD